MFWEQRPKPRTVKSAKDTQCVLVKWRNVCHYIRQPGLPRWEGSFVSSGVDREEELQRIGTLTGEIS